MFPLASGHSGSSLDLQLECQMGAISGHPESVESADLQDRHSVLCSVRYTLITRGFREGKAGRRIQFRAFAKAHSILEASLEHHFRVQVTQLHKQSTFQDFCN